MAGGFVIASEGGQYNGKITSFVVLSCMMAAMGGVIFGYDIGISGGVTSMEPFLKKFFPRVYRKMNEDTKISNYCKFDSQLLTSFTSSLYMAGLISSFFAAIVTRNYGRKPSIIIGGVTYMAGAALGGAAYNGYMLIIGRLLLGVGLGFTNQYGSMKLGQVSSIVSFRNGAIQIQRSFQRRFPNMRRHWLQFSYTYKLRHSQDQRRVGMANFHRDGRSAGCNSRIRALFLPETPNSLIQHCNDHERAKKMLQKIRGTDDIQAELDDLIEASYASKAVKHPFKNLMQRKYRPQLVMSVAIPFFQQITGINVVAFYAPLIFLTMGFGESASLLSALVTALVGSGFTLLTVFFVDKLGRRPLFHIGGAQMFISLMLIGGIMTAKLGDHGTMEKGYGLTVLVLICIYLSGFGLSWGPLGWVVTSEIFPLEVRSVAQSIVVAVNLSMTFIIAQVFLAMLCHLKSAIFFFFGAWVLLMSAFVYFLLPETKNIPIEKMDKIWGEHFFWKRFVDSSQSHEINKTEAA
ncbi:UNVERIFIED_CONTAM: Hexose carrier protein HEX6 [Sesamum latifolium]|uniref:Hexose carrier protein HEX6 n=1 Tax=Sesamum latifolium TaxID=2727402 RepID=A0AAW2T8M0_9LAMI